mgnify:CR=1 FL=1
MEAEPIIHTRMEAFWAHQRKRAKRVETMQSALAIAMAHLGPAGAALAAQAAAAAPSSTAAAEEGGGDDDDRLPFLDLRVHLAFRRPVEIWIDTLDGIDDGETDSERPIRFLFLLEPDEVTGMLARLATPERRFRGVFAHNPTVLRDTVRFPNHIARFEHGGTWILARDYCLDAASMHSAKWRDDSDTDSDGSGGLISFICGSKRLTLGHRVRHALWARQNELHNSFCHVVFFQSGAAKDRALLAALEPSPRAPSPLLGARPQEKVVALRSYSFHIAIENVRREGYFSEKLLDCFLTRTVPIYWGCPNIGEYFDVSGMILVSPEAPDDDRDDDRDDANPTAAAPDSADADEEGGAAAHIVNIIRARRCTVEVYERIRASGAMERNYVAAKKWIDLEARMQSGIAAALVPAT